MSIKWQSTQAQNPSWTECIILCFGLVCWSNGNDEATGDNRKVNFLWWWQWRWNCDGKRLMMCASFSPNAKRPNTIYDYFKNAQDNWTKHSAFRFKHPPRTHLIYIAICPKCLAFNSKEFSSAKLQTFNTENDELNCQRSPVEPNRQRLDIPVENVIVLSFVYVVHLTSVPKHSQVCVCICMFDLHSHLDSKQIFEELQWHS